MMKEKWQTRLSIVGIILALGIMFIPDWNNIGKNEIGDVSVPMPSFDGVCLGDSISKASSLLDEKYGVSCSDEYVTIEDGVEYCGIEFDSVELNFFNGVLTEMTFESFGRPELEKSLFLSAQSALISALSDNEKVPRNSNNYVRYDHFSSDSLTRYIDCLHINLEFSHFSRKFDDSNWRERQYGVVTLHVERDQYNINKQNSI